MRARTSVFIATSVDGFIARPDGSIDWLLAASEPAAEGEVAAGEDYGYAAFIATVDALVMGRGSWEQVLSFPEWPYGNLPVTVLSSRDVRIPPELADRVSRDGGEPAALLSRLGAAGRRHLYIDGGVTIQRFLAAGLIDELIITRIPVLLGEGRPLFGPLGADVSLEHQGTRSYANGLVQSRYRVRLPSPD